MTEPWLRPEASGSFILNLHVQPGAGTSAFAGLHGDALKIRLAAPPVDGKANKALLAFLAEQLDTPKSRLELVSGASSRVKRLRIRDASEQAVAKLLAQSVRAE